MQSVPEDSLATPSKVLPLDPALGRVTDAESADGSPKIHVGRQSSMQLSNIMTNQLFEQDSNGLAQELPAAEMAGRIGFAFIQNTFPFTVSEIEHEAHTGTSGFQPAE